MEDLIKLYIGDNNRYYWNPPDKYKIGEDNNKNSNDNNNNNNEKPELYFRELLEFTEKYSWLYRERTIDFYLKNVWSLVPEEWSDSLLSMTDLECLHFTTGEIVKDDWPESLRRFIIDARSLWLPKKVNREDQHWKQREFNLPSLKLKMSDKKIHEIQRMSEFIDDMASVLKPDEIIDIGSGEGYLTQVLSHQYGYSLSAVDCSESFIDGAIKRQNLIEKERVSILLKKEKDLNNKNEINKENNNNNNSNNNNNNNTNNNNNNNNSENQNVNKKNKKKLTEEEQMIIANKKKQEIIENRKKLLETMEVSGPKMCVAMISPSMRNDDFIDLLMKHDSSKQYRSLMMIGLHTCGQLASTMLSNYVQCNRINSIIDVGCCYYRVPAIEASSDKNQPAKSIYQYQSHIGKSIGVELGPAALKLSCEAAESSYGISENDVEEYRYSMKVHFYRVILETALRRYNEGKAHNFTIRCISRANSATFEQYAMTALKRMNSQQSSNPELKSGVIPTHEQIMQVYNEFQGDQQKINIFLLLRGILSPILESIIIMDRWLYLNDNRNLSDDIELKSFIIPIFKDIVSPRNYAIFSFKINK